jgi:hypothetical protein
MTSWNAPHSAHGCADWTPEGAGRVEVIAVRAGLGTCDEDSNLARTSRNCTAVSPTSNLCSQGEPFRVNC